MLDLVWRNREEIGCDWSNGGFNEDETEYGDGEEV